MKIPYDNCRRVHRSFFLTVKAGHWETEKADKKRLVYSIYDVSRNTCIDAVLLSAFLHRSGSFALLWEFYARLLSKLWFTQKKSAVVIFKIAAAFLYNRIERFL